MNSKLLTGLSLAALLLIGGPAFGKDNPKGGGGRPVAQHAVGAGHRSVSFARNTNVAAFHRSASVSHNSFAGARRGPVRNFVARNNMGSTQGAFAANRIHSSRFTGGTFANNRNFSRGAGRNNVAFGGHTAYARNGWNGGNGGNGGRGRFAFASHRGWDRDRDYNWDGHRYGWYNDGWYIIDVGPVYGYNDGYYSPGYGYNGDVAVQVQTALQQAGYYEGPIDGIVGPGTSAAIAAYQRDNGLRVTGTITPGLVQNLGVG